MRIIAEEHDEIVEVELPNGGVIRIFVPGVDVFYVNELGFSVYLGG